MTATELIDRTFAGTQKCSLDIRKAALLRIARVQTKTHPQDATKTLRQALELPDNSRDHFSEMLLEQSARLAVAAVAPELLSRPLPSNIGSGRWNDEVVRVMLEHGHGQYLRTYVLEDAPPAAVPISGIVHLISQAQNDDEKRLLLRRAVEAQQGLDNESGDQHFDRQFEVLFRKHYRLLPEEDARRVVRSIVRDAIDNDSRVEGKVQDVRFTSKAGDGRPLRRRGRRHSTLNRKLQGHLRPLQVVSA